MSFRGFWRVRPFDKRVSEASRTVRWLNYAISERHSQIGELRSRVELVGHLSGSKVLLRV